MARRVLPIPPTPVRVISRSDSSDGPSTASSSCRPTIGLTAAAGSIDPDRRRCGCGRRQPWVVGEDRLLDVPQRRAWLDPQLVGEQHPDAAERRQRVGWAASLVQRSHQQSPGTLPIRVGLDERLELADASLTLATVELSLGRVFDDGHPQFDEALHLARRHRTLGNTVVRLAAKRFVHIPQHADGHLGVATAQRLARRCDQPGDSRRVDLDELGIQSVPAIALGDRRRTDGPTQPQDVSLQRLARRRRRTRRPQRIHQHVHRNPLTQARRQCGEQRLFRPSQPHHRVAIEQLHGAEDTHLHQRRRYCPLDAPDNDYVQPPHHQATTAPSDPRQRDRSERRIRVDVMNAINRGRVGNERRLADVPPRPNAAMRCSVFRLQARREASQHAPTRPDRPRSDRRDDEALVIL